MYTPPPTTGPDGLPTTTPEPTPPKRHRVRNWTLGIGGAAVGLVLLGGILSATGGHPANPAATSTPAAAAPAATTAPPSPPPASPTGPAQFGRSHGFVYDDGLTVQVIKAVPATVSSVAAGGHPGDPAVIVTVRVSPAQHPFDASEITVNVNAGPDGTQLEQVFDENTIDPSGTVSPGSRGTYSFEYDVQQTSWENQLDVTVTPGFDYSDAAFAGSVSG